MKRSEVNKDPGRAIARAGSDLRCAVRKLGIARALATMADMAPSDQARADIERLAAELRGGKEGAA